MSVNNQTIREVVHTSIGGDRVRAWCSATHSARGRWRSAARTLALFPGRRLDDRRDGSDRALTFGGEADDNHSTWRGAPRQRSGHPRGADARRCVDRSVPPQRHRRLAIAADHPQWRTPDQLHFVDRESSRRRGSARWRPPRRRGCSWRGSRLPRRAAGELGRDLRRLDHRRLQPPRRIPTTAGPITSRAG